MHMSRKRKRGLIEELFGGSIFNEESWIKQSTEGGYSISVVQNPEGTKVKAKVGKDTDVNMLSQKTRII